MVICRVIQGYRLLYAGLYRVIDGCMWLYRVIDGYTGYRWL